MSRPGYYEASYPPWLFDTPLPPEELEIDGLTVTITTDNPDSVGADIRWGDNVREPFVSPASHTYALPGTYTITVDPAQGGIPSVSKKVTLAAAAAVEATATTVVDEEAGT